MVGIVEQFMGHSEPWSSVVTKLSVFPWTIDSSTSLLEERSRERYQVSPERKAQKIAIRKTAETLSHVRGEARGMSPGLPLSVPSV